MRVDMSSPAVTMRLRQCSELRSLCIALGGKRLKRFLKDKANNRLKRAKANQP